MQLDLEQAGVERLNHFVVATPAPQKENLLTGLKGESAFWVL
jgi:hypothetical protein